tara:strand:- start:651 stop:932 length:282 start_codon:yes stop_codon:yes gene_type:complete
LSRPRLIKDLKNKHPELSQLDLEDVVKIFTESIITALKSGKKVHIKGLGRFYLRRLKENFNARNPATSELIYVGERNKLRFKPSIKLNKMINE